MSADEPSSVGLDFQVRRLTAGDAEQYRALRIDSLRAFPQCFRSDYAEAEAAPVAATVQRLLETGDYWFGVFVADQLVGTAGLKTRGSRKVRHVAHLTAMMVARRWQGRGIGRLLVASVIEHARTLDHVRQIQLTVTDGNTKAEQLYDAFGFVQFGLELEAVDIDGRYAAKQHRQLMLR